jgi:hypothetical protein
MKKLVVSLGIAFVGLQAADAFLTMWAVNHGFQEVNPFLAPIAGTWYSPIVKILPAALVAWGLARLGRRYPRTQPVTAFGLVGVVALYAAVIASNLGEL